MRPTALQRAIESLKSERAVVLDAAIAKLEQQQAQTPKPVGKSRVVAVAQ